MPPTLAAASLAALLQAAAPAGGADCPRHARPVPLPRLAETALATALRTEPRFGSAVLAALPGRSPVTIAAECGPWRLVLAEGGREGWVHGLLLRPGWSLQPAALGGSGSEPGPSGGWSREGVHRKTGSA